MTKRDSLVWQIGFIAAMAGFLASQFDLVQTATGLSDVWLARFQLASLFLGAVCGKLSTSPLPLSHVGKVTYAMKDLTKKR